METLVTTNKVVMAGEVRGPEGYTCNYESLAEKQLKKLVMNRRAFIGKNSHLIAQVFTVNLPTLLWE